MEQGPWIAGLLALGLAACTPTPAATAVAAPPFDAARAWKDLEQLVAIGPRQSGTPGAEAARLYLEQELRAAGLAPVRESFREDTPAGPLDFANVYVDLEPSGGADAPWLLLCTHYDTKRLPGNFVGANDGGSGTAVLLELARALAPSKGGEFGLRLLFLDGEESVAPEWRDPDNRYGSRHHAAKLLETRRASAFKACILLDMVGDKELVIQQEGYSDAGLYAHFAQAAKDLKLGQHFLARRGGEILDDHLSFMKVGIRSVDLIDFEYGPGHAYWHTLEDKLEHCSQASLDVVGRVVLRALPPLQRQLAHR
jgi:glutaminyl-peptide cyclotransferase